jgi:hypothetical protein
MAAYRVCDAGGAVLLGFCGLPGRISRHEHWLEPLPRCEGQKRHPLLPRRGRCATRQNEHQGVEQARGAFPAWDTRPRQERPPSWCSWVKATPDPTPLAQQKLLIDATTAKPDEIAVHVRAAIERPQANRDLNPANAIILYAWNEHDEGGRLQPTLGVDGKPNDARCKALGKVLRGKTSQ